VIAIKSKVNIIDALMGDGKSSYMQQEIINSHPECLFLCIVPLKTEVKRYMEKMEENGVKFYTPKYFNQNRRKLDNIKELLEAGVNIISTHSLFLSFDEEVLELIKSRNYHLVIDEAVQVISIVSTGASKYDFDDDNKLDELPILTNEEIGWLFDNNCIALDPDDDTKIIWIGAPSIYHKYLWVENLAKSGSLVYVNNQIMIWHFPPLTFTLFESVTILTYMFERSLLRSYFEAYNIKYTLNSVKDIGDREYVLTPYSTQSKNKSKCVHLINICEDKTLNAIGQKWGKRFPLSANWYKQSKKLFKQVQNNAATFLRHQGDVPRDSVMWTVYKKYKDSVCPKGYKTIDEQQKTPSFVSLSARATNDYSDRYNLIYLCDCHINPNIIRFFELHNVEVDNDGYSLDLLLQWIFRNRIRKSEPINLYIPSQRMRQLLYGWLGKPLQ